MRFSLRVENNQADAGQDGRSRLARPNSQARAGTGKYSFSPDHEQVGNRWLIYTLLYKIWDDLYTAVPVLSTCPLHTNSECGKERRKLIGPW